MVNYIDSSFSYHVQNSYYAFAAIRRNQSALMSGRRKRPTGTRVVASPLRPTEICTVEKRVADALDAARIAATLAACPVATR